MAHKVITQRQITALKILEKTNPVNTLPAKAFGEKFWPNWTGTRKGLYLSAGSYLGKLRQAGLVRWNEDLSGHCGYYISSPGLTILRKAVKRR